MWSTEPENCQNLNPHTSKIGKLLPVCLTNNRRRTDHISELHAKVDRQWSDSIAQTILQMVTQKLFKILSDGKKQISRQNVVYIIKYMYLSSSNWQKKCKVSN